MQLLTLSQAYQFEKNEASQKIHYALQDVVTKIHRDNNSETPLNDPIRKISDDYYIVNVDDVFDATVLEYYLKMEFKKVRLNTDFEYAIYDCGSDEMLYGDYISDEQEDAKKCEKCFTKKEGLVYYFAVRFPELKSSYVSSLQQYWVYSFILVLVLVIYVYSVILLLKQKKYTELQSDFINNMTHEFKTPISSILIASNYAATQQEIIQNPKLSKYMEIVIAQSNKLNQHIEKILDISRSNSQLMQLQKTEFSVNDVFQLATETALLKYENLSIIYNNSDESLKIVADEFHFTNVIFNIIDNSVKYNDGKPELEINVSQTSNQITIDFTDNGIGIEPSEINAIFDKFYRISTQKRNEVGGFGLGLFYVKKIIELHRWKINIKNNPQTGITVSVIIPKN